MKYVLLIFFLSASQAFAGLVEYTAPDGNPGLYDAACYATTPDKVVPAPGGGYNITIPVAKDDCRYSGQVAQVVLSKRNLDFGTWSKFTYGWMTLVDAEAMKDRLESEYKNTLGLWCPTQRVEIVMKEF
jgi:hypothetical protein